MDDVKGSPRFENLDGLRLLALSRIPRCTRCPRLEALRAAYRARAVSANALPPVPAGCLIDYCAPLAARYDSVPGPSEPALPIAADAPRR